MKDGSIALGGLVPFSTVDFPGQIAAVLFTQGCPLRCRYCHNPHLQRRARPHALDWAATIAWLKRRQGLLDAVVISGGEPTWQPGLADGLADIRALGFATGLHSTGMNPQRLTAALPLLNWIGFDVKAPFDHYADITGRAGTGCRARQSLDATLSSGIDCEVRTTVHPALLGARELRAIARDLRTAGVRSWVLQRFRPAGCADSDLLKPYSEDSLPQMAAGLVEWVPEIVIR